MSDYTATEIQAAVEAIEEDENSEYYYAGTSEIWEGISDGNGLKELVLRGETVPVTRVDGKRGRGGGGEDIFVVVQVGDQFFEMPGYYGSEAGETWDGKLYEVRPEQKTITVYEVKK